MSYLTGRLPDMRYLSRAIDTTEAAMTKSEAFLSEHERTHQYTLMRDTFVAGLLFVGTTAAVIAFAMSLYVVQHRFPLW